MVDTTLVKQEGLTAETTLLVTEDETAVIAEEIVVDGGVVVTAKYVASGCEVQNGEATGPDTRREKKLWKRRPIVERLLASST